MPDTPPRVSAERPLDSVMPLSASTPKKEETSVQFAKGFLLFISFALYAALMVWCVTLLTLLPSPTGELRDLKNLGVLTCIAGVVLFIIIGFLLLQRIAKADVPIATRQRSLIKLALALLPGIVVCAVVPFMILREPTLSMETVPADAQSFVAPLSITLSVEKAASILRNLGYRPTQYIWDTDGDGKENDRTVVPTTTAMYSRAGSYSAMVRIMLSNGSSRLIALSVVIRNEVFSVKPEQPVVEQPASFSVTDLLPDLKQLKSVDWTFDEGGKIEETTKPTIAHVFYATGTYTVTAVLQLQNKTEKKYTRSITVVDPPPLPFPISLVTEPINLMGPAPFGALFTLKTDEPLKNVTWSFGDGKKEEGAELKRIGHSFDTPGVYAVEVQARSQSGSLANLTAIIRATEKLTISDLHFEGTPTVKNNIIIGDIPLTVQLKPVTSLPLIQFSWEAPNQDNITISGDTLQGVYRDAGAYAVTLVAVGPDGSSMRLPIKINVQAPGTESAFGMKPESGSAPLTVEFDASNAFVPPGEDVAGFKWQFGDEPQGKKVALGGSKTEHTFTKEGQYVVTMTIVTATGKEYPSERTIVVLPPTISACITASRTKVAAGKGVAFDSSCSTGTYSTLLWDVRSLDDPNTVIEQSADPQYVHVFDQAGDYVVTLTLKTSSGLTDSKTISIIVTP